MDKAVAMTEPCVDKIATRVRYKEALPLGGCDGEVQKQHCTCALKQKDPGAALTMSCSDWDGSYLHDVCTSGCETMVHNEINTTESRVRWGTPYNFFDCVKQVQIRGTGARCHGVLGGTSPSQLLHNFLGWCVQSSSHPSVCDPHQTLYLFPTCALMWPPHSPPVMSPPLPPGSPLPAPSIQMAELTQTETAGVTVGIVVGVLGIFGCILCAYTAAMRTERFTTFRPVGYL